MAGRQSCCIAARGQIGTASEAAWRSGYAADCKSVHSGSIPDAASNFPDILALLRLSSRPPAGFAVTRRFQRIFIEALPGRKPWEQPTAAQLTEVAASLDEQDIGDIVAVLDELSLEKDATADWDGDTSDDTARAQTSLIALLRPLTLRYPGVVQSYLDQVVPLTRIQLQQIFGSP
jgi:hypothetical protein